jgi:hypothetical protein
VRPPGRPFQVGQSGNPGGMSKAEREWRDKVKAALRKQETPYQICKVAAAMRTQALMGEKASPAAAKVYFEVVGAKDAVTLTEQERIQLGVRAELERLLGEAEAAQRRGEPIDVTPVQK